MTYCHITENIISMTYSNSYSVPLMRHGVNSFEAYQVNVNEENLKAKLNLRVCNNISEMDHWSLSILRFLKLH